MEEKPQQQDYRDRNADEPQQDTLAHFLFSLLRRSNVRVRSQFHSGMSSAGGGVRLPGLRG